MTAKLSGQNAQLRGHEAYLAAPRWREVDLTLHAGEIYRLLGPNGAGKSTLIAAALGLLPRHADSIAVFGLDPAECSREIKARVGLLPERLGSLDCMSAAEYLGYFARLHGDGLDRADIERRLQTIGFDPRSEHAVGIYSRGMQQRLGIARALLADPELLILEHPTNELDPGATSQLHDLLRALATRLGVAILLSTHRLDEAEQLCSRVGLLVRGRTVVEGRLSELRGTLLAALVAAEDIAGGHDLLAAGWPTMGYAEPGLGLEQIYLRTIQAAV